MNKRIVMPMLCVALAAAAACTFNFSTAKVADAKMAKGVNDKFEAIEPTTVFDSSDKVIHCLVYLANAPDNTKVRARWLVVNAKGQKPGDKLAETDIDTGNSKNNLDFTLKPSGAGLPAGDYKVDIFLNPQPGKEEPPAKSLDFTIKASAPTISQAYVTAEPDGSSPVTEFPAGAEAFYAKAQVAGATDGTKITASLIAVQVEDTEPNKELKRVPLVLTEGQGGATFTLTRQGGFQAGSYRVDFYLNDSPTPAKSITFTVAE
jgi:hypothetical protein